MQDTIKIGKDFLAVMDLAITKGCYQLADDAILDWFGQIIHGRGAIKQILLERLEKTHHSVRRIKQIAAISHVSLNPNQVEVQPPNYAPQSPKRLKVECGQGDVAEKVTPDNPIIVNCEEMARAPGRSRAKKYQITRRLQFIEVKGKLTSERLCFDGRLRKSEVSVSRIVMGIDDEGEVSFVMYEGNDHALRPQKLVFI